MANVVDHAIDSIRKQVGTNTVICGLSGGVDSSVLAALLHKAIGTQLVKCIFVDNGLLLEKANRQSVGSHLPRPLPSKSI